MTDIYSTVNIVPTYNLHSFRPRNMALTMKQWLILLLITLAVSIIISGLLVYVFLCTSTDREPVVKSKVGLISGLNAVDGDYDMFLGVPYAFVNKDLFGESIPYGKFKNVFRAHDDSIICPQYEQFNKTIKGSLDCLNLNIYVPHTASTTNPVPVVVFIHGGDYKSGFGGRSLYGPKYLMKHDIILVTVNYRMGPYGFLCTDLPEVSGNQGLKDQILALRWISENIESFGGKSDQITLAGVGSGGENVNLHLLYDKEQLFHKVIIDSGIYLDQLDEEDGIESFPIAIAENLGFKTDNERDALNFLNTKQTNTVIASSMRLHLQYGPCIEKNTSQHTLIINRQFNADNLKTIPILISHSNNELMVTLAHQNFDDSEANNTFQYELVEHFKLKDERLRKAEEKIRKFFIGDAKVGEAVRNRILDFKSDLYHNIPNKRMIEKYLKLGAKIYYGIFSYSGGRNFMKQVFNINTDGASKEDVLGYIFDMPYIEKQIAEKDQLIIDRMTTLWANFVKYGNPTPVKTELLPAKWEAVTQGQLNYMEISSELMPKVTPFYERTVFWDLFFKMNGKQEVPTKPIEPWLN